jgi:hypothetical protein
MEDAETMVETVETDAPGRQQVRELLIGPLGEMGLRRPKGVTAAEQAARVERMVDRLAYLTAPGLLALRAAVERLAGGALKDEWPSELVVVRIAWGIEPPPATADRLFTSYLASAAGKRAFLEMPELAAELANLLHARRRPPLDADWDGMRARAATRRRELGMAARREADGRASADDLRELTRWRAEEARLRELVFGAAVAA